MAALMKSRKVCRVSMSRVRFTAATVKPVGVKVFGFLKQTFLGIGRPVGKSTAFWQGGRGAAVAIE